MAVRAAGAQAFVGSFGSPSAPLFVILLLVDRIVDRELSARPDDELPVVHRAVSVGLANLATKGEKAVFSLRTRSV